MVCGAAMAMGDGHDRPLAPHCARCGSLQIDPQDGLRFYPAWLALVTPRALLRKLTGRRTGR
jgi:hypothetical protein